MRAKHLVSVVEGGSRCHARQIEHILDKLGSVRLSQARPWRGPLVPAGMCAFTWAGRHEGVSQCKPGG